MSPISRALRLFGPLRGPLLVGPLSRPLLGPVAAAFLFLVSFGSAGCEDKAIGRPCDVQADGGTLQAVFNGQALECPSRMCIKPARDQGVVSAVDTTAYCTAECSKDSDCDGETRNPKNGKDRRCSKGFVCGVAFETGPLCCKKVCLCKDFLNIPAGGLQAPASCNKNAGVSMCQNL